MIKGYLAISKYAPRLLKHYNQERILAIADEYDRKAREDITVFGKSNNRATQLDAICVGYIGTNQHLEMLSKYPVLQLAYNQDGTKKDIVTLLKDRAVQLENGADPKAMDELYRTIANQKNFYIGGLEGVKPEILSLGGYIQETGTDDEFVYDLLRDRLQMKDLTPERIEAMVQHQKEIAEARRKQLSSEQNKGQQEIKPQEQESIKDEVGDELKAKTDSQVQDEKMAELDWMHRVGTVAQEVDKTVAGVKGKQEVIQLVKEVDKQQKKQIQQEEQEEQLQQ